MRCSFSTLPLEVLEHIAYRLALVDLHGPPTHLLSLLCTSRPIYNALSIKQSPHLYARIFRAKFDCRAVAPRFTEHATYAAVLANQLVRYCLALKNIRRGDIYSPSLLKTFYRAFALCSENDGRNAEQLEWAGLSQFVERYVFERLWEGRASPSFNQWPVESGENTFALWLYWYSLTPHMLAAHTEEQRNYLQILLRPYAVYNFRYPPFLAPDIHFRFPLNDTPDLYHDHSVLTPHGYYPQYREPKYVQHSFTHYDTRVSIAEPPIGLVAKLLYVALIEHQPQEYPAADLLPVDRAEAAALGVTSGPTLADYYEFGSLRAARPPERGDWDSSEEHSRSKGSQSCSPDAKHLSTLNEIDWERWRGCYDPWNSTTARNHDGYTHAFGSLTGLWGGRYLDPTIDDYLLAINSAEFVPELEQPATNVTSNPLFFKLREHHCISPATPLPAWEVMQDPFNEGVMNAYCPRDFRSGSDGVWAVDERGGRLRIRKRGRPEEFVYETYVPGKRNVGESGNGHDEERCALCARRRQQQQPEVAPHVDGAECVDDGDGDVDMVDDATYADEDASIYDSLTEDSTPGDSTETEDDIDVDEAEAEPEDEYEHILATRRIIQHALGAGTDIDGLIQQIANASDDNGGHERVYLAASDVTKSSTSRSAEASRTKCTGVQDIVITGETPRRHALAWRDFRLYGRVRRWDGLVVLVRAPVDPPLRDTYVFRGYLVGGSTLVGAWRHVTDSVHSIPLEGTFVVSRIADCEDSAHDGNAQQGGQEQAGQKV